MKKINAPTYAYAEIRRIVKDQCPDCGNADHIETVLAEGTYVDDEEHVFLDGKPSFLPYKDYQCGFCGCVFRTYLGPIAAAVIKEADIEVEA